MSRSTAGSRFFTRDFGYCLKFDGATTGITFGSLVPTTGAYTIGIWAKTSVYTTNDRIIDWSDAGPANGTCLSLGASNYQWFIDNGVTLTSVPYTAAQGKMIGSWHHFVLTYDGVNGQAYLDGAAVGSPVAATITAAAATLTVGKRAGAASNFYNGLLDEFFIANTALTAAQVTAIYYTGVYPTSVTDLFRFDTGSGTTATNAIGSTNGTITAASWSTNVFSVPRSTSANRFGATDYGSAVKSNGTTVTGFLPHVAGYLTTTGDYSYAFWVKPLSLTANQTFLAKFFSGTGPGIGVRDNGSVANPQFQFWTGDGTSTGTVAHQTPYVPNTWYHLVLTKTAGVIAGYVNGVKSNTTASLAATQDNASNITLLDRGTAFAYAIIDDFRFFTSALSQTDITSLYYNGTTSAVPFTWYKLNEATGTAFVDAMANGGNGTLQNGSWVGDVPSRNRWTVDANQDILFARSLATDVTSSPNSGQISTAAATFTRATTGWYLDQTNIIQSKASGVARFTYETTNNRTGLLVEQATTNLVANIGAAAGVSAGVTETLNSTDVIDPLGTSTAHKLVYDGISGTAGSFRFDWSTAGLSTNGTSYTVSMYLRTLSGTATFRLGANLAALSGNFTATTTWQKFQWPQTGDGTHGVQVLYYSPSGDNSAFTVYAWCPQVEAAQFATSPVITSGVTVTRNADVLSYPTAGNTNNATGTVMVWIYPSFTVTADTNVYALFDIGGVGNNGLVLYANSSTSFSNISYGIGSTLQGLNGSTHLTQNAWNHVAATWTSTGVTLYLNGANVGSNTAQLPNILAGTTMYVGSQQGSSRFANGIVRDARIYGAVKSASQIASIYAQGPQ